MLILLIEKRYEPVPKLPNYKLCQIMNGTLIEWNPETESWEEVGTLSSPEGNDRIEFNEGQIVELGRWG
jgi:hypothetical protein